VANEDQQQGLGSPEGDDTQTQGHTISPLYDDDYYYNPVTITSFTLQQTSFKFRTTQTKSLLILKLQIIAACKMPLLSNN